MSVLRDLQSREIGAFGGPWLLPDPSMVTTQGALLARNVEYSAGQVGTRLGYHAFAWGADGVTIYRATDMYIWYAPMSVINSIYSDSMLATFTASGVGTLPWVQAINLKSGTIIANGAPGTAAAGASFMGVGMCLYYAYHDATQKGTPCETVGYSTVVPTGGGNFSGFTGPLFPAPPRTVPTTTEPAAGFVTAGPHRIGYILEYLSGFTGRACPDDGSTSPPSITSFAPVTITAAGSKNLAVTVTPGTWPSDIAAISVIMTTVGNLNQYYIVPGSRTPLTFASGAATITVDISDADLNSQGVDATPYLYWLTCASTATPATSGAPPFSASHLALFGDRMVYKGSQTDSAGNTIDCLYVSERNNYQSITADQHLIQLPGQRNITTMFRMGGNNYIVGPHEIYAVTDTGDVPVTWPAPHLVDGRTGTLAIHGVEVSPSGQYAWIADQSGLYLFQGAPITTQAVSYYQSSDWARINWEVAYTLQIKDDAGNKRLHVLVALDGSTTPTHIMTWDYTDGASYLAVRYSLDSIANYNVGAIELVRNDLPAQVTGNQKLVELWLAPRNGAPVYLRKVSTQDTAPYRDNAVEPINSIYRTCPLPGRDASGGLILMHNGFHARIKGAGTMAPILYDIDAVRSFTCRTLTMSTMPDADQLFHADLRGELAYIEFATNTTNEYWKLAYLKYYYSPYIIQR